MKLNWSTKKCLKPNAENDDEALMRETLIFLSMLHGFAEITEKNAREVYARIHMLEQVRGAYHRVDGKPRYFQPADVYRWIGLQTNVSKVTDTQFMKVLRRELQDFAKLYDHDIEKLESKNGA